MEYIENKIIETENLIMRPLESSDAEALFNNINHDKEVLKYYIAPYIEDLKDASIDGMIEGCKLHKRYAFAIVIKENNEVIGMLNQCNKPDYVFRNLEIGMAIGQQYWNKGYGSEALKAAIEFFFSVGIHKVYAQHIIDNIASKRIMEKAGMIFEGIRKDELYYHDKYHDVGCYYMLNDK